MVFYIGLLTASVAIRQFHKHHQKNKNPGQSRTWLRSGLSLQRSDKFRYFDFWLVLVSPIKTPPASFENEVSQMFNRIQSHKCNEWADATKALTGQDH
jgi:hypothetical protein